MKSVSLIAAAKSRLRRLAELHPEILNPLWKIYYKWNRPLVTDTGRFDSARPGAFTEIYQSNFWGSEESVSGSGSTLDYTRILRKELPLLLREFDVKVLLDAPCGDFNWMQHVALGQTRYIGCDIVEDLIEQLNRKYASDARKFAVLDIVEGQVPDADLWLCRDVLFHLPNSDVLSVLNQFARSNVKYLLTTTFDIAGVNPDVKPGGFRHINLLKAPFNLPKPIRTIDDFVAPFAPRVLGLWTREQVRNACHVQG